MNSSYKTTPKNHGDDPAGQDPHASDAEDMAQFAQEDQVDISNLGEPVEDGDDQPSAEQEIIAELTAQLATAKEQTMRALAEAENTRKRSVKDRQDAGRFAVSTFARDMLDVADNLRRALEAVDQGKIGDDPQMKNLLIGIEGTEKVLLKAFEKNQIKQVHPMDEPFDPNFHEVMFETPMPDKAPGTVIQVMETGYILHDRLLRPARVGVVKAGGAPNTDDAEPGDMIDQEI